MNMIALPGVRLFVETTGSGPPLLFLHGLGSSALDWRAVTPAFGDRQVIVCDVRGHGRSEKPGGAYGVPLFARDVAALLDHLGLAHVDVVGLSMGGMIGLQLALDRPDLVQRLVVLNSGPEVVPRGAAQWLQIVVRFVVTLLFGPRRLAPMVAKKLFPHPHQQALRDEVQQRIAANDPWAYLRASWALLGWSVLRQLPSLQLPVLVVSGDRDYTPIEQKRAWMSQLANARLEVIADSGHATPGDQPDALTRVLRAFLDEQPAQA